MSGYQQGSSLRGTPWELCTDHNVVVDCSPSARVPVGHRSERCGGDTHSRCKSFADRLGRRIRNHILPHVLKMVEGFGDQNMGNTTPGAIDGMKDYIQELGWDEAQVLADLTGQPNGGDENIDDVQCRFEITLPEMTISGRGDEPPRTVAPRTVTWTSEDHSDAQIAKLLLAFKMLKKGSFALKYQGSDAKGDASNLKDDAAYRVGGEDKEDYAPSTASADMMEEEMVEEEEEDDDDDDDDEDDEEEEGEGDMEEVMEHPTTTTGDNVADDTAQAGPSSGLKVETSAGGPWFRCEECGKRFNSETSVRKHVSAMHRRSAEASATSSAAASAAAPRAANGTSSWYRCEVCGKRFQSEISVRKHASAAHPRSSLLNNGPSKCFECGKDFNSLTSMRKHAAAAHKRTRPLEDSPSSSCRCYQCGKELPSEVSLRKHTAAVHSKRRTMSTSASGSGTPSGTSGAPLSDGRFRCKVCGKALPSETSVKKHFTMMHKNRQSTPKSSSTRGKDSSTAAATPGQGPGEPSSSSGSTVPESPASAGRSVHHKRQHARACRCEVCGQLFSHKGNLRQHMAVHRKDPGRPYDCRHCGNTYITAISLERHILIVHPQAGVRPKGSGDADGSNASVASGSSGSSSSSSGVGSGSSAEAPVDPISGSVVDLTFSDNDDEGRTGVIVHGSRVKQEIMDIDPAEDSEEEERPGMARGREAEKPGHNGWSPDSGDYD